MTRMKRGKSTNTCALIRSEISLILFAVVTWRMTVYANTMKESGEVSMNLELPEHLVIYVTAFCLLTFTLVILRDILNNIRKLKS